MARASPARGALAAAQYSVARARPAARAINHTRVTVRPASKAGAPDGENLRGRFGLGDGVPGRGERRRGAGGDPGRLPHAPTPRGDSDAARPVSVAPSAPRGSDPGRGPGA